MTTATASGMRSSGGSGGGEYQLADTSGLAMAGVTAATNTITSSSSNNSMTTSYLQSRLSTLKSQSQNLSNELTKRLATSRSGQSLLNIGPSLSTLPPDLSSLLEAITPLLHEVEIYEKENVRELNQLVNQGREVQTTIRKRTFALECAEIYRDLVLGEDIVRWDNEWSSGRDGSRNTKSSSPKGKMKSKKDQKQFNYWSDDEDEDDDFDNEASEEAMELDHASSLEHMAYTAFYLLQELQSSSEEVAAIAMMGSTSTATNSSAATAGTTAANTEGASSNTTLQLPSLKDDDNYYSSSSASGINSAIIEKSKYLMKLSPRIRRLESDAVKCLVGRLEDALIAMRSLREEEDGDEGREDDGEFRMNPCTFIDYSLVHVANN